MDIEPYARELIFLQHQLMAQLKQTFCPDGRELELQALPRYGAVEEPSTLWGFSRHGLGIRFVDIRTLAIVDIEHDVDTLDHFTLWRLASFLRSKGETESAERLEKSDVQGTEHFMIPLAGKRGTFRLK